MIRITGSLTFLVGEFSVASQFKEEVNEVHFTDCCSFNFGFAGSGFSVLRPAICETRMLIS